MTTALLTSLVQLLLTGLVVCGVFAVGALWQARTTRYWRNRAVAAERRLVQPVHVRVHPQTGLFSDAVHQSARAAASLRGVGRA